MSDPDKKPVRARMMSLERLKDEVLPLFLDPLPADKTLRAWFAKAKVKTKQANQHAQRGGGPIYYAVADVEKMLA